jgi:hypothetical protein
MSDLWRPEFSGPQSNPGTPSLQPTDEDVVRALVEIKNASSTPLPSADSPIHVVAEPSLFQGSPESSRRWLVFAATAAMAVAIGYLGKQQVIRLGQMATGRVIRGTTVRKDGPVQMAAEQLLARVAAGDSKAADDVLAQSAQWTGRTQRTPQSEQMVSTALNLPDIHARTAAVRAELALDGVTVDAHGLDYVKRVVGNPQQRVWALWMLGALGNQGVDPDHTTKIIETYLADPNVQVRAAAVDGLALVATEETIPMMLDRFRNDPSPVVQERAACGLAQSGMYRQEQRMTAARSLVGWVDDSMLNPQQHGWTLQALGDISGQHFGNDAAAWRHWYENAH